MKIVKMLEEVMADSVKAEDEAHATEQNDQAEYENFMKETNKAIAQEQKAIANMSEERAKDQEALIMDKSDWDHTMKTLENLSKENKELHDDCDYVLKNFEVRQETRQAE